MAHIHFRANQLRIANVAATFYKSVSGEEATILQMNFVNNSLVNETVTIYQPVDPLAFNASSEIDRFVLIPGQTLKQKDLFYPSENGVVHNFGAVSTSNLLVTLTVWGIRITP